MTIARDEVTFAGGLRRYVGIILTLLRREEELRRHTPLESVLELLEPIILIGIFTGAKYYLDRHGTSPLGGSVFLFYATGFFPKYYFIYISIKRLRGAIGSPRHRFPIERRLDFVLVHIILKIIDYTVLGFLVFGGMYAYGITNALPRDIVPVLEAMVAITMLAFGWGMLNVVLIRVVPIWIYLAQGMNRVLIVLSGALYVPEFLPPTSRYVLSFNPELHAIALFRTGFYEHYPTTILDKGYLFYCAIGFVFLGLVLERVTRRLEI